MQHGCKVRNACSKLCNTGAKLQMGSDLLKKNNRNSTRANQVRAVDKKNRNKMAAAVGKVWKEQKHILIHAKLSRINGNNKYISQSTRNWKFGQHKWLNETIEGYQPRIFLRDSS